MSPRRIRRERSGPTDHAPRPERVESWPDGEWIVHRVIGSGAAKAYRCPGCDQEIVPGVGHVVAWRADGLPTGLGVDERRHWHTTCWQYRLRRGQRPRRVRKRNP